MHRNLNFIYRGDDPTEIVEQSGRSWLDSNVPTEMRWRHELRWRYSDGTEAVLTGNSFYGDVIPAKSGFEILRVSYVMANENPIILRQPVIAWRNVNDGDVDLKPIVQDDSEVSDSYRGILQPDGRVLSSGIWHSNENAFLDAVKATWLKQKERMLLNELYQDCPFCAERRRADMDDDIPF